MSSVRDILTSIEDAFERAGPDDREELLRGVERGRYSDPAATADWAMEFAQSLEPYWACRIYASAASAAISAARFDQAAEALRLGFALEKSTDEVDVPELRLRSSHLRFLEGDKIGAEDQLLIALNRGKTADDRATALMKRAIQRDREGHMASCLTLFEESLGSLGIGSPPRLHYCAWAGIGRALASLGKFSKGREALTRAEEFLDPSEVLTVGRLTWMWANLEEEAGSDEKARKHYREALDSLGSICDLDRARLNISLARLGDGDLEEARRILGSRPNYRRATAYLKDGRLKEAEMAIADPSYEA